MRPIAALLCFALCFTAPASAQDAPAVPADPPVLSADASSVRLARSVSAFDPAALEHAPARAAAPLAASYANDSCGRWDDQFGLRGVNGTVRAVVRIGTDLYVAGIGINQAGGTPVSNIAKWDGTSWTSIGGTTGQLYCLATDGTNLYVGGSFSTIGGVSASNLARWNGTTWSSLWTTSNGGVEALAVRGTDLYVGGNFTSVNGNVAASRIARWNGSTWSTVGGGLMGSCYALAWGGDTLYAAGNFTELGTGPGNYVAKWDGTSWSRLGDGLNSRGRALCLNGNDVYVGGEFTTAGGVTVNKIAKWNGSSWSALGSGASANWVEGLAMYGGNLYAVGSFAGMGGVAAPNIARWDGVAWSAVGSPALGLTSPGLYDLLVIPGSGGDELLATGYFESIGGIAARGVARWNGSTWAPVGSGNGVNGFINWLGWGPGGSGSGAIYAAGSFNAAGNVAAPCVARYDVATNQWSALGSGMNALARSIAVSADGNTVYAGGDFTQAGGVNASKIARWNGSSWSAMGAGLNNRVEIISVAPNGDVYAGGTFTNFSRIAKWNGTAWSALGTGVNSVVEEIQFADNGVGGFDVIVVGQFTTAGGVPASRIAKWNGSAWSAFGSGVDGIVDALWVDPRAGGYDVYVGGYFLNAGGQPAKYIAKWDGAAWSEVGGGMNASVNALVKRAGVLYAGGNFTTAGGDSVYGVAAWDGSTWSRLGRGVINSGPDAIVVSDTSVYLGGLFTNVGCVNSANFARFSLADPLLAVDDAPLASPALALSPPAPNPFRGSTTIAFRLPDARHVSLRVHDVAGREVAILADGVMSAGRHELRFDARGLSHGVYFCTMRAGSLVESRKMLIVR
ncbi:MAG: T9SS type A sorting domain-containing protein [Candidatus Eisenbacteria bacterium]|uniref:T9SS type A sorting domain-containing protein n=1 Tax=Eiseniibacteriota bacterium TaxID=2212470 RepID=A0A933SI46_UNCEI|nr:T9SS type A sorting domain-containing protein [Candidatus Eisenbacteria bacterium]